MVIEGTPFGANFSPGVKREARRLAGFKCCYCRERPGDDVHHIMPKECGGQGVPENAILLCAQCHRDYGDRQDKQQQLRQARDDWYEIVARRWSSQGPAEINNAEELATKNTASVRVLKTCRFLLEKQNGFYKQLVEHLCGTIDNAAPILINSRMFDDFVVAVTGRPPLERVFTKDEVKAALDTTFGQDYTEQTMVVFLAGVNPLTGEHGLVVWGTDEESGALMLSRDALEIMKSLHRNLRRLLASSRAIAD